MFSILFKLDSEARRYDQERICGLSSIGRSTPQSVIRNEIRGASWLRKTENIAQLVWSASQMLALGIIPRRVDWHGSHIFRSHHVDDFPIRINSICKTRLLRVLYVSRPAARHNVHIHVHWVLLRLCQSHPCRYAAWHTRPSSGVPGNTSSTYARKSRQRNPTARGGYAIQLTPSGLLFYTTFCICQC